MAGQMEIGDRRKEPRVSIIVYPVAQHVEASSVFRSFSCTYKKDIRGAITLLTRHPTERQSSLRFRYRAANLVTPSGTFRDFLGLRREYLGNLWEDYSWIFR